MATSQNIPAGAGGDRERQMDESSSAVGILIAVIWVVMGAVALLVY